MVSQASSIKESGFGKDVVRILNCLVTGPGLSLKSETRVYSPQSQLGYPACWARALKYKS